MSNRLAVLAMLAAVLIYGANFAITRHATQNGLTPADIAALRFAVAGSILLPFFIRSGVRDCAGIGWARGLALAAMSGIPMVLLMNQGLSLAPAAHGASIQPGTVTVIGAVGSAILFKAIPPWVSVIGLVVVLAGLACIGIAGTTSGSPSIILGDLHFLAAGTLWGLYPLMLQRWSAPAMTSTAVVAVLSMAYLPFYLVFAEHRIFQVDPLMMLFHGVNQGVFNVILGLWLWGSAVRSLGAATAQRFPPLIPVVGTLAAVPILGEWPGVLQAAGVALIVSGLLLASFGPKLAALRGARVRRGSNRPLTKRP